MSRATAFASAAAGQPRSPSTVATRPSFASAPAVSAEVLGVVDQRQAEHARVGERVPEQLRVLDRRAVVAEAGDAGVGELAERRQLLPCPPGRGGAERQQPNGRAGRGRGGARRHDHRRAVESAASCWASRTRS